MIPRGRIGHPGLEADNLDLRYYRFSAQLDRSSLYYAVFPEGGTRASESLAATEALLLEQPLIDRSYEVAGQRARRISKTPFSLIYRVVDDEIEVIRVLDSRSNTD